MNIPFPHPYVRCFPLIDVLFFLVVYTPELILGDDESRMDLDLSSAGLVKVSLPLLWFSQTRLTQQAACLAHKRQTSRRFCFPRQF